MTRFTAVPTLLLVLIGTGSATAVVWHLTDTSGPSLAHEGMAFEGERMEVDGPTGAAMSAGTAAGRTGPSAPPGPTLDDRTPPPPALVARWDTERKRRRAALGKRVREMTRTQGWLDALRALKKIREGTPAEDRLTRYRSILEATSDPVARQNLIFLTVLTLPTTVSHPWLEEIRLSEDPGDAEDALVALAFDGAPAAHAEFEALAARPAEAEVRRIVDSFYEHDIVASLGSDDARRILRSYRAIEVLQRRPYFHRTHLFTDVDWVPHPRAKDREVGRSLREAWLARYPGHPGSDDMAWHVGRAYTAKRAHFDAARWYSLAASLPDTDMTYYALRDLLVTCELFLTAEDVGRISPRPEDPNFDLLDYVAMRKVAARRGLEAALQHAAMRGRGEPTSLVGHAWNYRRSTDAPRGLKSGRAPLPADDPLWHTTPWRDRPERPAEVQSANEMLTHWYYRRDPYGRDKEDRLNPAARAMAPWISSVVDQLRSWEAVVELEQRADRLQGEAAADLRYKAAAVIYHNELFLFPLWDYANRSFPYVLRAIPMRAVLGDLTELHSAREQFEQESYSPYLAIRAFERIARDHPGYSGADKVLFSRAMAFKRLIDFWPFESHGADRPGASKTARIDQAVREMVVSFEHLVAEHPDSTLADDAALAAAFWRKERPKAFGR